MTLAAYDGINAPTLRVQLYKSGIWTDTLAADLREIHITRGRLRADQPIQTAVAIITFENYAGIYDPDYTIASTWVVSGASIIRDGLAGRVVATWSAVDYILFTGVLETAPADPGFDPTTTMTFVDGMAQISKVDIPALPNWQYSNETTSARVSRILTKVGWTAATSLTGTLGMQSTTQGLNALTMIEQCAAVQAGSFYVSRTGTATLLLHTDKFSRPTQLLFHDDRSANTVEYDRLTTTPGTLQVVNQAVIKRGKFRQKVAKTTASVTKWGLKSRTIEAFIQSEVHAQNLAHYYAYRDSNPTTTVSSVSFSALALGVLFPDFLTCELQDQVTVKRNTVDGRLLTMNLVVEGMDHTITPTDWRVTFNTSPMNPYRMTI
jgi:hypothetical protein